MTRLIRRTATLALLLAAAACQDATSTPPVSFVTATVDGFPFRANYYVDFAVAGYDAADQRLEIVGLEVAPNYSGRQITLIIQPFTGTGTYQLGAPGEGGTYATYLASPDLRLTETERQAVDMEYTTLAPTDGSVEITQWNQSDMRITGTFAFDAYHVDDNTQSVSVAFGNVTGNVVTPGQ